MEGRTKSVRRMPRLLILLLVAIVSGLVFYVVRDDSSATVREAAVQTANAFTGGTFEASGATQVPGTDGILFVDDGRPSEVLWMQLDKDGIQKGAIKPVNLGTEIDDPEGITTDGSSVYVIGSQSKKKGADQVGIVRFEFSKESQNSSPVQSIRELKRFLLENVAELRGSAAVRAKDDGLNIEGLAWDPIQGHLLLGLRSPVVDGNALLVPLKLRDPRGPFSNDNLDVKGLEVHKVSLGGQGIRSIEYDERQKLFHIISGATESQDKTDFKLWEWGGPADRSRLREVTTFDSKLQPEGVTPASIDGSSFKFVVFDTSRYLKVQ